MSRRLAGQACLVTGGGTGMGRAIAQRFAAEGAHVIVTGRRPLPLEETAAGHPAISALPGDVTIAADARRMVETVVERHGKLDVLVHAAGVLRRNEDITQTTEEEWLTDVDANLTGTFQVVRYAIPQLRVTRGAIILVASQLAHIGAPGYATYAATKGGVLALMRALAVDLGPAGVRVNALTPGLVETDMAYIGRDFAAMRDQAAAGIPLRRVGQPEDVAGPAVFLASAEAAWVTGHSLVVDGGFTAQ